MKLVFGRSFRQKPIELLCPGGKIIVARAFGGTVVVRFVADNGVVEVEPGAGAYSAGVRLTHEGDA